MMDSQNKGVNSRREETSEMVTFIYEYGCLRMQITILRVIGVILTEIEDLNKLDREALGAITIVYQLASMIGGISDAELTQMVDDRLI